MIPYKEINLDKPRKVKFNVSALITAETLCGKKGMEIVQDTIMFDMNTFIKLLCAGLRHEDKDLTVDKVTGILDTYMEENDSITPITDIVTEMYCKAIGVKIQKPDPSQENEVTDPNLKGPIGI